MPTWSFLSRGSRRFGPWIAAALARVLQPEVGARLCTACLALALSLSLEESKEVLAIAASLPGFRVLPVICGQCGRLTESLCLVSEDGQGDAGVSSSD